MRVRNLRKLRETEIETLLTLFDYICIIDRGRFFVKFEEVSDKWHC